LPAFLKKFVKGFTNWPAPLRPDPALQIACRAGQRGLNSGLQGSPQLAFFFTPLGVAS